MSLIEQDDDGCHHQDATNPTGPCLHCQIVDLIIDHGVPRGMTLNEVLTTLAEVTTGFIAGMIIDPQARAGIVTEFNAEVARVTEEKADRGFKAMAPVGRA